jgi:hypothetical protein
MNTRESILAVALVVCAAIGGLAYLTGESGMSASRGSRSPEEVLFDASRDKPGDADLGLLFEELNARHFSGALPNVKVLWDEDLHRLDVGD